MNCDMARESMVAAIDAPWDAADRKAVEDHLAGCAACARFWQVQLAADQALTAKFAIVAPNPALAARIRAATAQPIVDSLPGWLPDALNAAGAALTAGMLASLNLPTAHGTAAVLAALTLIAVVSYPILLLRRG